MKLILPYPISANRYWETYVPPGSRFANTYVSKEAKGYKRDVRICAHDQGCRKPIAGRVSVAIELYPHRPIDWERRSRRDPMNWDDTVTCLDVDNACKVLLDALKKIAFGDDAWVRKLAIERMEPDADGDRVVVTIEPIVRVSPQAEIFSNISWRTRAAWGPN